MALVFEDTFTDTDNTLLTAHTPDTGTGWTEEENTSVFDGEILSNQLRISGNDASDHALYSAQPNPTVAEYDVEIDVAAGDVVDDTFRLVARYQGVSDTYIAGGTGSINDGDIWKEVGGTPTELASTGRFDAVNTYKFEIRDAAKKLFKGAAEMMSTTDNAITAAGKWGVSWGNVPVASEDTDKTWRLDNFKCTEVAAAVPPFLVMAPYIPA